MADNQGGQSQQDQNKISNPSEKGKPLEQNQQKTVETPAKKRRRRRHRRSKLNVLKQDVQKQNAPSSTQKPDLEKSPKPAQKNSLKKVEKTVQARKPKKPVQPAQLEKPKKVTSPAKPVLPKQPAQFEKNEKTASAEPVMSEQPAEPELAGSTQPVHEEASYVPTYPEQGVTFTHVPDGELPAATPAEEPLVEPQQQAEDVSAEPQSEPSVEPQVDLQAEPQPQAEPTPELQPTEPQPELPSEQPIPEVPEHVYESSFVPAHEASSELTPEPAPEVLSEPEPSYMSEVQAAPEPAPEVSVEPTSEPESVPEPKSEPAHEPEPEPQFAPELPTDAYPSTSQHQPAQIQEIPVSFNPKEELANDWDSIHEARKSNTERVEDQHYEVLDEKKDGSNNHEAASQGGGSFSASVKENWQKLSGGLGGAGSGIFKTCLMLVVVIGLLYLAFTFQLYQRVYDWGWNLLHPPKPPVVQVDFKEENLVEWGVQQALLFGSNNGRVQDRLRSEIWDAFYFGKLAEPKAEGEIGLTSAYYFGTLQDILAESNRFIAYVQQLREVQSMYQIDVYGMLDQVTDRGTKLFDYLKQLQDARNQTDQFNKELSVEVDNLKISFNSLTPDSTRFETDFFVSLQNLAGEKSDFLLKSFVDVAQKQASLKARLAALQRLQQYYTQALQHLDVRIKAVDSNKEALVNGIHVTNIPGANLNIIIPGTAP
ncbi:MAG: hypothetical protein WC843_04245 [Candidatus Gracilibacteria bacterium]|jgi:hypothetical protein